MKCRHDPFTPNNSVIVEAHWGAGVRLRCKRCGFTAQVTKNGRCAPDAVMNDQIARMAKQSNTRGVE